MISSWKCNYCSFEGTSSEVTQHLLLKHDPLPKAYPMMEDKRDSGYYLRELSYEWNKQPVSNGSMNSMFGILIQRLDKVIEMLAAMQRDKQP
jgi:hypothetical protein